MPVTDKPVSGKPVSGNAGQVSTNKVSTNKVSKQEGASFNVSKENKEDSILIDDDKKTITLSQIKNIFIDNKLKESNPEEFYNYYEARDWRFNNGNKIHLKALKALASNWNKKEIKFKKQNLDNGRSSKSKPYGQIKRDEPDWLEEFVTELDKMEG